MAEVLKRPKSRRRDTPPPQRRVSHSPSVWAASLWVNGRGATLKGYKNETDESVSPATYNLTERHTARSKQWHAPTALRVVQWKVNWSSKFSPAQRGNIMSFPLWCVSLHIFPTEGRRAAVWLIRLSGRLIKATLSLTLTWPNGRRRHLSWLKSSSQEAHS